MFGGAGKWPIVTRTNNESGGTCKTTVDPDEAAATRATRTEAERLEAQTATNQAPLFRLVFTSRIHSDT